MTKSVHVTRLGELEVAYAEWGQGPALVLVHGLGEDHRSWAPQRDGITDLHAYAYDLRGHGNTSLGEADGTLAQLTGDLVNFLDRISGPAICVGFSLGGTVVLSAAARAPELVRGAIVLGTSTVVGRVAVDFYTERIGRVGDDERVAEAMRADTAAALQGTGMDVDALTAWRIAAVGDGLGYANAARAMASLREDPLTPSLAEIRCPVAVIGADGDTFCPRKAADIMLDAIPGATYQEIPGAGHLMNVDNPSAVTAGLLAAAERMSSDPN